MSSRPNIPYRLPPGRVVLAHRPQPERYPDRWLVYHDAKERVFYCEGAALNYIERVVGVGPDEVERCE